MTSHRITRNVIIDNPEGLHARPAELVARTALKFASRVELINGSLCVDAKSILHVLTLGAQQGTNLTIQAEGDDAEQAADALVRLITEKFAVSEVE